MSEAPSPSSHVANQGGGRPLDSDPICAPATPTGGALCLIRLSGQGIHPIVDTLTGKQGAGLRHLLSAQGDIIDQAVVTRQYAPRSYTGEDAAEITIHGSPYILDQTLQRLTGLGCRIARPGEFTQRAFLNGKLDLAQAEAVADLIAADSHAAHQMAIGQLRGHTSAALNDIRQQLLHLATLLELELDFSDHEDLTFAPRTQIDQHACQAQQHIVALIRTYRLGQAIKQGIHIALVGRTNVGKSTLFNQLAGDDRAIVSPYHGTTRDTIDDSFTLQGLRFRLTDTAGLRNTPDPVEQLGIQRTKQAIAQASIVIHVSDRDNDAPPPLSSQQQLICVRNKTDLYPPTHLPPHTIPLCAKTGEGIDRLRQAILQAANLPNTPPDLPVINNARHLQALTLAEQDLQRLRAALANDAPAEILSEDLRQAAEHIAQITGHTPTPDSVLENIFRNFCVGK